jgi:hypothetical protein
MLLFSEVYKLLLSLSLNTQSRDLASTAAVCLAPVAAPMSCHNLLHDCESTRHAVRCITVLIISLHWQTWNFVHYLMCIISQKLLLFTLRWLLQMLLIRATMWSNENRLYILLNFGKNIVHSVLAVSARKLHLRCHPSSAWFSLCDLLVTAVPLVS